MYWLPLLPSLLAFVAVMVVVGLGPTVAWWIVWGRK